MLKESNFQALGINWLTHANEEIIEEGEQKSNLGMKSGISFYVQNDTST